MNKAEQEVLVYLVKGFLESGKTSFLNYTVEQEYFQIEEPTLLISCEEGEIEYHEEWLHSHNTHLEVVAEAEQLTMELFYGLQKKYGPARVLIECNCFWEMQERLEIEKPKTWQVIQRIVTVDGSTFDVYMNNMRSLFMEMAKDADMIIFNRCKESLPLANYRRSIKVLNPAADIIFEGEDGKLIDIFDGSVPYDLEADPIEIDDADYGIFYVDMRDNPKRYKGKKVKFKGRVLKSRKPRNDYFVPARLAMTCCADDTSYIGYICKTKETNRLTMGDWVEVTADVRWEWVSEYKKKGPVLYACTIEKAEPPQVPMVYFN